MDLSKLLLIVQLKQSNLKGLKRCIPRSEIPQLSTQYYTQQNCRIKESRKKRKKLKFMTTKSAWQRILKGILQSEEKDKHTQECTGNK